MSSPLPANMTVVPKAPGRPKKTWSPEELALKEAQEAAVKAQKALEKEEKAMVKAQEKAAASAAKAAAKEAVAAQKAAVKAANAAGMVLPLPPSPPVGGSMHAIPVGLDQPNVATLMAEILQCHMRMGALLGALHNAGH